MSVSFNHVIFIGLATSDPVTRTFENGGSVSRFGLAVEHQRHRTMLVDVVAYDQLAEACAENVRTGANVLVDGRLVVRTYHRTGDDDSQRSGTVVEVVAQRVRRVDGCQHDVSAAEGAAS